MRPFISFLTCALFFIWILPLGVFIKPSQEKEACAGQRAICLCSHLVAKQIAKNAGKIFIQATPSAAEKENNGGTSHHFLVAQKKNQFNKQISLYHRGQSSLYSLLIVRSIEHVPKA